MNRLNVVLSAEEIIDLKLLHDYLRRRDRGAFRGQDDNDRDWGRAFRVTDKLIQAIGSKLEKHEEP